MELNSGICGVCNSGNEIIKPDASGTFWETICGIFKDELDNLLILKSELNICPTCIFHARLIDTKKDIFKSETTDVESKSINKCRFCKDNASILKVENSEFLKKFESSRKFKGKGWSAICASCYYVIKATFNLRTNLTYKLSELKTLSSTAKDGSHSINNEAGSSSHKTNSLKKAKKLIVEEKIDEFSKKNSFDLCSDASKKQLDENISYDLSEPEAKKDDESKEYEYFVEEIKKKEFPIEDNLSNMDISNIEIEREEYVLISDEEHISKKSRRRKNKKLEETLTPCGNSKKEKNGKNNYNRMEYSSSPKEILKEGSADSLSSLDSDSHTMSRKRKMIASPGKFSSELKKLHALQSSVVNGLDMSNILSFMPLSETNVRVNEVIRQDAKFYTCIPYVKVSVFKTSDKFEKKDRDILEHIWTRRPCTSPTGIIKRTPPIKIKLKKVTKFKKDISRKKESRKNSPKRKSSTNSTMLDEFKKKEVVVKVERMKLPTLENEVKLEKTTELEVKSGVTTYESALKHSSEIEVTPKKKKKVHFNDTPTIIITGDEMSEDLDSTIEDEDISHRRTTRNGKTLKHEKEILHEEADIEIDLEESEDEKNETPEEEKETTTQEIKELLSTESEKVEVEISEDEEANQLDLPDKKKETTTESEKVEVVEIEMSEDKEANQVDQLEPGKECNKVDSSEGSEEKIDNEGMEESEVTADSMLSKFNKKKIENESEYEAITPEKCNNIESNQTAEVKGISPKESLGEKEESNNLHEQVEKEIHKIEDKNNIQVKSDNDKKSDKEEECVVEAGENVLVEENIVLQEKRIVEQKSDIPDEEIKDSDRENEEPEDGIDDTEQFLENVDIVEVEKKKGDELDADKIIVNDIVLSEATAASEDFGSLIDEVQKCLTSSKDLSSDTNEDPVLELHASPDDLDKVFEKDDSLSCLNDIDRGLESSFAENLIEVDKISNVGTDISSLDKGIKRKLAVEDDTIETSAKHIKLDESLK